MPDACGICDEPSVGSCRKCSAAFCLAHQASIDEELCESCLNPDTVGVKIEPLVDEEGVKHKGKKVTISGEVWQSNTTIIATLNDDQLTQWIEHYTSLVRDAEVSLEYRRAMKGSLEFEQGARRSAAYKLLSRTRMPIQTDQRGKILRQKKSDVEKAVEALAKLNVTPEKLADLMAKAKEMKVKV